VNWMVASILASVAGAGGPLLMVESVRQLAHHNPNLDRQRRRLWVATLIVFLAQLAWLYGDRAAVGAGHRSLAVATVSAGAFAMLFVFVAYPALQTVHAALAAAPSQPPRSVPIFRARADVPVVLLFGAALVGALLSPNDLGYRLKGTGMIAAALTLYFFGRPRALRTFLGTVVAAAITLFIEWEIPWQRTIGMTSQLAVGVLGFIWCARLLTWPR